MFQKGNKLAAKGGQFGHELQKAITQGDPEKLRRIAEKLLTLAEGGDLSAIREVADRLDGKAVQTVNSTVEHIVDAGNAQTIRSRLGSRRDASANPVH